VDAIAWRAWRKQILHRHFQNFREIEQRFAVNIRKPCLDFGDAAAADIEPGELQLRRNIGLRPA
jgi:hypothetical protein